MIVNGALAPYLLSFLLGVSLLTSTAAYARPVVTDWRTGQENGQSRVVLDLMDIAEYKAFTLQNPHRIVIDIAGGKWSAPHHSPKDPLIKGVRHGVPSADTLRIVLDLRTAASIRDSFFILPDGKTKQHKLVLDLRSEESIATAVKTPPELRKIARGSDIPLSMRQRQSGEALPIPLIPSSPAAPRSAGTKSVERHKPVIVVDAGHGGIDPGAIGKSGRYEKDVTLRHALALRDKLEKSGRYTVVMTRTRDTFISLNDRVARARKADADLFISLHADSHPDPHVRGLSVYTISESRAEREARRLENDPNLKREFAGLNLNSEHPEVQQVLIDMVQRDTNNTSVGFADILVEKLGNEAQLLKRSHRFGSLAVLTNADIPSVLVELGYMSNRYEEKLLITARHRGQLVNAISDAVDAYFSDHGSI